MKNIYLCAWGLLAALPLWAQHGKSNMPWVDLSAQTGRQTVIAAGTPELYNGHPTTVMLDDRKTIFCTWSSGHGGEAAFLAQSNDAGRTWSPATSLDKPCVMAFSSIVKLNNGHYMGFYHRGDKDHDRPPLTLWKAVSTDGGLTWGPSQPVGSKTGCSPCEPCVFRTRDGKRLVCVARENERKGHSLMMTSVNEGETWSPLVETPWGLTGDRHVMKYTPDGRLVAVFRDMAPGSPTKGHFVAWVGTDKDLREGTSGQYKVKLLHSYAGSDCGYPGLEILPDGTILAITYVKIKPGSAKHSIVMVRFTLDETDAML